MRRLPLFFRKLGFKLLDPVFRYLFLDTWLCRERFRLGRLDWFNRLGLFCIALSGSLCLSFRTARLTWDNWISVSR